MVCAIFNAHIANDSNTYDATLELRQKQLSKHHVTLHPPNPSVALPPLLQIRCSVRTFIVKGKTLRLSPPPKPPGLLIIAWMICCSRNCGVVFTIYPPPLHSLHTDRHIRTFPSPSVSSQHRSTSISLCAPCAGSTLETFPPSLPSSLSVVSASLSHPFSTIHAFLGWVSESVRPKS